MKKEDIKYRKNVLNLARKANKNKDLLAEKNSHFFPAVEDNFYQPLFVADGWF